MEIVIFDFVLLCLFAFRLTFFTTESLAELFKTFKLRSLIKYYCLSFISSLMPKGKQSRNTKKASHKNDDTFGRPKDDKLEAAFMIKLRNGRLQTINA